MLGRNGALILGEMPTALHVQIVVLAPPASAPPSHCSRWPSGRTRRSRWASPPPISRHDRFKRATAYQEAA
jgi:hypothetical protein